MWFKLIISTIHDIQLHIYFNEEQKKSLCKIYFSVFLFFIDLLEELPVSLHNILEGMVKEKISQEKEVHECHITIQIEIPYKTIARSLCNSSRYEEENIDYQKRGLWFTTNTHITINKALYAT